MTVSHASGQQQQGNERSAEAGEAGEEEIESKRRNYRGFQLLVLSLRQLNPPPPAHEGTRDPMNEAKSMTVTWFRDARNDLIREEDGMTGRRRRRYHEESV